MNLRILIDSQCPIITCGRWQTYLDEGWRWVMNLNQDADIEERQILEDYLLAHGRVNVALGHAFSQEDMMPVPSDKLVGLYVRDYDQLLHDLRRDLNRYG